MKLVRGRAFGLRNTAMICGCPLDRLLATCPFSEAHSYNCLVPPSGQNLGAQCTVSEKHC